MQDLQTIKKAIILYTAVTVIEQLLIEKKNFNFLYPLKKKHQSNRNKRPKKFSKLSNEKFIIPECSKSATDSVRRLVEAASRYCKR